MILKVGKRYVTRDGQITDPIEYRGNRNWFDWAPYFTKIRFPNGHVKRDLWYGFYGNRNGHVIWTGFVDPLELVSEYKGEKE